MFELLGRLVFRLRYPIVVLWAAGALGAVLFAPSLSRVGSADQSAFLPADAESMRAKAQLAEAFPDEASGGTATIAFSRSGGLTEADQAYVDATAAWLTAQAPDDLRGRITSVVGVTGHPELAAMLASADGQVQLLRVQLTAAAFQPAANEAAGLIRDHLTQTLPNGLQANVTGSVGIGKDYLASILAATDRTTIVTIALVVLVLLLIYRAPVAALVPLLTIGAAYLVASGILGSLAQAGWRISSLIQTFVIVLVFGVGTDYTIFLISRFREETANASWADAILATERRIGAVIAASAATVVVGLSSMAIGRFVMFQTTGPALAIAIVVTLLAGLTLAPALLAIFGRSLFWPRHERDASADGERGFFARLARSIARRPLVVTISVLVALAVPAVAVGGRPAGLQRARRPAGGCRLEDRLRGRGRPLRQGPAAAPRRRRDGRRGRPDGSGGPGRTADDDRPTARDRGRPSGRERHRAVRRRQHARTPSGRRRSSARWPGSSPSRPIPRPLCSGSSIRPRPSGWAPPATTSTPSRGASRTWRRAPRSRPLAPTSPACRRPSSSCGRASAGRRRRRSRRRSRASRPGCRRR